MPDYTYAQAFLVDVDGEPVRNATGGQFLSNEGVAQQVYDLNGSPLAELTSSSIGVVSGFKADLPYGQVAFGSVALPVYSIERQAGDPTALTAAAEAAAAAAEQSRIAAQTAADTVAGAQLVSATSPTTVSALWNFTTAPTVNGQPIGTGGGGGGDGHTHAFAFPYTRKVDARASVGLQGAARPDAPLVIWAIDPGQATPANFQSGSDPKYDGDTLLPVTAV